MSLFDDLLLQYRRLIEERASAMVIEKHIALMKAQLLAQFEALQKDNEQLKNKYAEVVKENAELKQQLAGQQKREEFVEKRGAAFKLLPNGRYSETPVCPHCHRTMHSLRGRAPFECSNKACGHIADLKGAELSIILEKLNKQ